MPGMRCVIPPRRGGRRRPATTPALSRSARPAKRGSIGLLLGTLAAAVLLAVGVVTVILVVRSNVKPEIVATVPAPNFPQIRPNGPTPEPPPTVGPKVPGNAVGNLAKEIDGEDLDGKKFKLSDYRGKVVLLDFWGNW